MSQSDPVPLIEQGIPTEVILTYCALSDYANNKSGECFPKMETLAYTLNRSVRTVQRHLHLLREKASSSLSKEAGTRADTARISTGSSTFAAPPDMGGVWTSDPYNIKTELKYYRTHQKKHTIGSSVTNATSKPKNSYDARSKRQGNRRPSEGKRGMSGSSRKDRPDTQKRGHRQTHRLACQDNRTAEIGGYDYQHGKL
jgi:Helix-turn-helix domain